MENDFRALLAEDFAIAGLVATRITPGNYEQGVPGPALRYAKITGAPGLHMQGSDGLSVDVMQIDMRSTEPAEVLTLRHALVTLLHGFTGNKGRTWFQLVAVRDDRGTAFETTGAEQFYTRSIDFDVISRVAA